MGKIKEKMKRFWDRNKAEIIMYGGFFLMLAGLGVVAEHTWSKGVREEKERMAKAQEDWDMKKLDLQRMYEEEQIRMRNDPANQIPGGGYVQNDGFYETDCPWANCNEVPLASMGEFGQEMIRRLKEQYPDYEKIGPFDPDRATAYLECYFGACEEEEKEILEKYKEEKAA